MLARLDEVPGNVRERTAAELARRRARLERDLAAGLAPATGRQRVDLADFARILLNILEEAVRNGWVDGRTPAVQDLSRFVPPLAVRHLVRAVRHAERVVANDLSLDDTIGASPGSSQAAADTIAAAAIEISAVVAESHGAAAALRDPLTTLLSPGLFGFLLAQEAVRALRHRHGLAMVLFDVDGLADLNRRQGRGAGDWVIERLGVLARQFFRTQDVAARYGSDAVAVLLPETPLDQAAAVANRFRQMIRQRLVLVDRADDAAAITVSAAAVGTDLVNAELDSRLVCAEAEAAVTRAQMNGGDRLEMVALLPTSVTIAGAATLLGVTPRDVARLLRRRSLHAARRGRHLHIAKADVEGWRRM